MVGAERGGEAMIPVVQKKVGGEEGEEEVQEELE